MTTDDLQQRVAAWLVEDGEHRVPDHLETVLARTAAIRQRPAWASLERWLPMDLTARTRALADPALGRTGGLILVSLLVAALLALAVAFAGSRQRLPAPFGPARNGDVAFGANGDIHRLDLATGTQVPLITGETWDFGASFSRDGTRFMFGRVPGDPSTVPAGVDPGLIVAMANADGSDVRELTPALVGNCASDWSPDGRHYVFRGEAPDGSGVLHILDVDAATLRTIDPGISVRCSTIAYRPPSGTEIIFRGDDASRHGVFAIRPDGGGFRQVNTDRPDCDCDTGSVSPDGRYLAVDRWDFTGRVRLWLLDLEAGTEQLLILPEGHFARGGAFSPDGSLVAFPMLHEVASDQNAYQVAVAPIDGSTSARGLGAEITLPATGTDEAFVSIAFTPDGRSVIAVYPDSPTSTTNTIWILPIDGTPGRRIGAGTFASLDIQRRAP